MRLNEMMQLEWEFTCASDTLCKLTELMYSRG
jgi:hypothetical protein